MTRGKQDAKSAARIARSKPGSREANAALRAAERNQANAEQKSSGSSSHSSSGGYCQNLNRSGAQCSNYEPCDAHGGSRRAGT